jgi:hypothetical protein
MAGGYQTFPNTGRIANGTGDGMAGITDKPDEDSLGNAESNKDTPGKKKRKRRRKYNLKKIKGL